MFTIAAMLLIGLISWLAMRANEKDRPKYEGEDRTVLLALHIRQDMQLLAYLLYGVIVMLGVVADRVG